MSMDKRQAELIIALLQKIGTTLAELNKRFTFLEGELAKLMKESDQ